MVNEERFFTFGLDLRLQEVDRPKDMANWTDKPFRTRSGKRKGFAEENLETVLSVTLNALLPDEEWFVIGRQESVFPDPDITALTKACDLMFFEAKRGRAEPAIVEQGLGYLMLTRDAGFCHYASRFLRMQMNRDFHEAIRILGLAQGATLDTSGPAKENTWARLKKYNDTSVANEEFLDLGRRLLRDITSPPVGGPLEDPQRAFIETFDTRFGFEGYELLHGRLGKSATLVFVAEEFPNEVLRKVQAHAQNHDFFYLLRLKLYGHKSEPGSFLLGFTQMVPDGVMSEKDSTSIPEAFETWRFLRFLREEIIRLEALDRERSKDELRIPMFEWRWLSRPYRELHFYPTGVGHGGRIYLGSKEQRVGWAFDWMTTGTCPGIRDRIKEKLREYANDLPTGVKAIGDTGNLVKDLQLPAHLDRRAAQDLAEDVYSFLTFSFALYDSCGLWDDPYDAFAKPG